MADKGLRNLTSEELGIMTYEQAGFDIFEKDSSINGAKDYMILYPGVAPFSPLDYEHYFGNDQSKDPHWIGIMNVTPGSETIEVQASSVGVSSSGLMAQDRGSHLSLDGKFEPDANNFIAMSTGEIIYGKFDAVAILKTSALIYKDHIRLIRGI